MNNVFGNWKRGKTGGCVVSDVQTLVGTGHDSVDYYGGYLVAESIPTKEYVALISAAPELLECLEEAVESLQLETGKENKKWIDAINKAKGI